MMSFRWVIVHKPQAMALWSHFNIFLPPSGIFTLCLNPFKWTRVCLGKCESSSGLTLKHGPGFPFSLLPPDDSLIALGYFLSSVHFLSLDHRRVLLQSHSKWTPPGFTCKTRVWMQTRVSLPSPPAQTKQTLVRLKWTKQLLCESGST